MSGPKVLYYVPRYLIRSQRFIWQQARDLPRVRMAVLELLPDASEFPLQNISALRPRTRFVRSLDYRSRRLMQRAGAQLSLTPVELVRLTATTAWSDIAYTMFLWNAFDLVQATRITRTPLVVHAAGSDVTTARSRGAEYMYRARSVFEHAELILCGSSFLRREVIELGADPAKCEVHYLGIDLPRLLPRRVASQSGLRVVSVSRLHAVKGVDRSIRAFALALGGTQSTMTIIGDGPERSALHALVAELGMSGQIRFLGEVSHVEVYDVLATADVFLQHNVTTPAGGAEALGGSLLEAAAHQVPVIATTSGGAREALIEGVTGFVVEEGDIEAMAGHLAELAQDEEQRVEMGRRGRHFVEESHSAATQNAILTRRLAAVSG